MAVPATGTALFDFNPRPPVYSPHMSHLILHPKTVELRARRDRMRARLAELVGQRLSIIYEELPRLRYLYSTHFGALERTVEEKTLEMSERKRMVELFVLKLDRGQTLDRETINLTLKAVYREFARMRGQIERMVGKAARREGVIGGGIYQGTTTFKRVVNGPEERSRDRRIEMKKIYRVLAKRLHPDVAGDNDQLTTMYWDIACRAYEREDLELMRTLVNVIETGAEVGARRGDLDAAEEIVRLIGLIDTEEIHLRELRASEPYSTREKLEDDVWIEEMRARLRERIAEIEKKTSEYNEFLAPILSRGGTLVTPESMADVWSSFLDEAYLSGRR